MCVCFVNRILAIHIIQLQNNQVIIFSSENNVFIEGRALVDMEAAMVKLMVKMKLILQVVKLFSVPSFIQSLIRKFVGKELDPVICDKDIWIELNNTEYHHPLKVHGPALSI